MRATGWTASLLGLAALVLVISAPVNANDYHVALTGSDSTGDGSAVRPWRTITHALATLPAATSANAHALRLGPGLWLPGNGEIFPLLVPQGVVVIGAGPRQTVIAGRKADGRSPAPAPTAVLIRIQPGPSGWLGTIGPSGVENLSLDFARIGIEVVGTKSEVPDPRIRNVDFWQNQVGVQVTQAAPTLEQCTFASATMGLAVTRPTPGGPDLVVRDCRFLSNLHGINATNTQQMLVERNRFERNGTGVLIGTLGSAAVMNPIFRNNVYLRNGSGFTATALAGSQTLPTLAHETFAFNNTGIASVDNAPSGSRCDPVIRNCIIWGSLVADVSGVERDEIRNSGLQTVTGAVVLPQVGQNGITSADPQFVDGVNGDVHLGLASPMIDRGRSDYLGAPTHDMDGDPRQTGFPDLGADEFQGFLRRDTTASGPGLLVLRLTARADAGLVYAAAASYRAGGSGGIPIGARRLPLHPDALFFATVGLSSGIPGFLGTLNAQGRGTVNLPMPRLPLPMTQLIHFAFITLDPAAPSGVRTISNPVTVDLATP